MRLLDPGDPTRLREKRLCLIGLRGAGKSTLGKIVSKELSLPFLELNREIEEVSGIHVNEVMALYGQEGYTPSKRSRFCCSQFDNVFSDLRNCFIFSDFHEEMNFRF